MLVAWMVEADQGAERSDDLASGAAAGQMRQRQHHGPLDDAVAQRGAGP